MNNWTQATLLKMAELAHLPKLPDTAVETGTYRGGSAIALGPHFKVWHTIDISPQYTEIARKACQAAKVNNVQFHTGDSRVVLPQLLSGLPGVLCIFLDAHFSRTKLPKDKDLMVHRPDGADFPLYTELEAIAKRKQKDLVIVDDWKLAGTEPPGCRAPGDSTQQWATLNEKSVATLLGGEISWFPLMGTMVFYRR